jgi:hypothetical protein
MRDKIGLTVIMQVLNLGYQLGYTGKYSGWTTGVRFPVQQGFFVLAIRPVGP